MKHRLDERRATEAWENDGGGEAVYGGGAGPIPGHRDREAARFNLMQPYVRIVATAYPFPRAQFTTRLIP